MEGGKGQQGDLRDPLRWGIQRVLESLLMPDTRRSWARPPDLLSQMRSDNSPCVFVLNCFCHVQLFLVLWTVALQTPLSLGFHRQEYWTGLPCPPPGDLPDPRIEPVSLTSPALAGRFFTTSAAWEAPVTKKQCATHGGFSPHYLM